MTNPMTEEQEKSKAYTAFKHNVNPNTIIALLDELMQSLKVNPSPENAVASLNALNRYQIITMDSNDTTRWLSQQPNIQVRTFNRPLHKRLLRLLKTGDWLDKQFKRTDVQIHSASPIPINVPMDNHDREAIREETVATNAKWLAMSFDALRTIIKLQIEEGPVGIFERPHGITNMNRINDYLNTVGGDIRAMGDNLRVHDLATVAENAVYTVNA